MSHLLQVLLLLALIVAAAKLAGATAVRIGQPAVFGEILIGLLLGPTAIDVLGWPAFTAAAGSTPLLSLVEDLADIGVILLMFVAGLETDVAQLRRVGRVAFWSAAGGVALPMAGGIVVAAAFGIPLFWQGIFIGAILTATSVSISAQTLMELGVVRSHEGAAILGAAVIDDVMGIIVLSIVVALSHAAGRGGATQVGIIAVRLSVFFAAAWLARPHLDRVAGLGDRLGVSQGLLATVLVVALLFAWTAEFVGGVAAITGAYIAGALMTESRYKERIDQGIHPLTYSVLVPVFFISIGLRADARTLAALPGLILALVAAAVLGKVIGCAAPARLCGFTPRQSLRVGVGMISRGEVGLIVASYGLAHGLIGRDVFSAAVVVVLATTMMTPPLLRAAFGRVPEQRIPVEESIAHAPARGLDRSPHRTMTRMLRGAEVRDELRRLLRER